MKVISQADIGELVLRAAEARRQRANLNLHPTLADPVQRFFNAVNPGSYVRPHRHDRERWETFVAVEGRAAVLLFDEDGTVRDRAELACFGAAKAAEVPGGAWHTIAGLEPGTVLLELKPGPYRPIEDKDFAVWSPSEGDPSAPAFERWLRTAQPEERPPGAANRTRGA